MEVTTVVEKKGIEESSSRDGKPLRRCPSLPILLDQQPIDPMVSHKQHQQGWMPQFLQSLLRVPNNMYAPIGQMPQQQPLSSQWNIQYQQQLSQLHLELSSQPHNPLESAGIDFRAVRLSPVSTANVVQWRSQPQCYLSLSNPSHQQTVAGTIAATQLGVTYEKHGIESSIDNSCVSFNVSTPVEHPKRSRHARSSSIMSPSHELPDSAERTEAPRLPADCNNHTGEKMLSKPCKQPSLESVSSHSTTQSSLADNVDHSDGTNASGKKPEIKRPRRALSAYNIFFKVERQRILDSIPAVESIGGSELSSRNQILVKTRKRKDRPNGPHRKISFPDLAKTIGERWKVIQSHPDELRYYQDMANQDKRRYDLEMKIWKSRQADILTERQKQLENTVEEATKERYFECGGHDGPNAC